MVVLASVSPLENRWPLTMGRSFVFDAMDKISRIRPSSLGVKTFAQSLDGGQAEESSGHNTMTTTEMVVTMERPVVVVADSKQDIGSCRL